MSSLTQLLQTQSQILDEQIAEQTTAANVVQSLRAMHNNRGSEERAEGGGVGQIGRLGLRKRKRARARARTMRRRNRKGKGKGRDRCRERLSDRSG